MERKRFPPRKHQVKHESFQHQVKHESLHPTCRGSHRRRNLQLSAWKRLCRIRSGWSMWSRYKNHAQEKSKTTTLNDAHHISSTISHLPCWLAFFTCLKLLEHFWNFRKSCDWPEYIFHCLHFNACQLWSIQISNCWKVECGTCSETPGEEKAPLTQE